MQNHAAEQLDVEVAQAQRPLRGFTHAGERLRQKVVEGFALLELSTEPLRLFLKLVIRKRLKPRFELVNFFHQRFEPEDNPLIGLVWIGE